MKFSAAVIGLGVGEQHLKSYITHSECEKVYIIDTNKENLAEVYSRYPQAVILNSEEEIYSNKDIRIVSIASYDNFHSNQIIKSLKSGKHVFCEKPICQFEDELEGIYSACKENSGLALSSNLILRKSPRFIELREEVRRGKYGRIYHIEADYLYGRIHKITSGWRGQIPYYSIMGGGGVHMIDLVTWITGEWPVEVTAMGNSICSEGTQFSGNDFVVALLKYNSGLIVKLSANFGCVQPHFHHLKIFGTEATFTNTVSDAVRHISRDPESVPENVISTYPGVGKGDYLSNFINSVLNGREPEIPSSEVFDIMSVIIALDKAALSGKTEHINYLRN